MKTECPLCREDFSEQIMKHITSSNMRMVRILEEDPNLAHGLNPDQDPRHNSSSSIDDNESEVAVRE